MNLAGVVFGCWLKRVLFLTAWGALVIAGQNCYAQAADERQEKGKEEIEFVPVMIVEANVEALAKSEFVRELARFGVKFDLLHDYLSRYQVKNLHGLFACPKHLQDLVNRLDKISPGHILYEYNPFWHFFCEMEMRNSPEYERMVTWFEKSDQDMIDGVKHLKYLEHGKIVWLVAEPSRLLFFDSHFDYQKQGLPAATEGAQQLFKQAPQQDIVAAIDLTPLRPAISEAVTAAEGRFSTEEFELLRQLEDVEGLILMATAEEQLKVGCDIVCRTSKAAQDLKAALEKWRESAREELVLPRRLGGAATGAELLKSLSIRQVERRVELRGTLGKATLASIEVVQQEVVIANHQRQALISTHNYIDAYQRFPFLGVEGQHETLSWRVAILPFMDEMNLYRQFDLSEPWDSPQNKALLNKSPAFFGKDGMTNLCWVKSDVKSFEDIQNIDNTICFISTSKYVPWTQNNDLSHHEALAMFAALKPDDYLIVTMYDGSVRKITREIDIEEFERMLIPKDDE